MLQSKMLRTANLLETLIGYPATGIQTRDFRGRLRLPGKVLFSIVAKATKVQNKIMAGFHVRSCIVFRAEPLFLLCVPRKAARHRIKHINCHKF